MENHICIGKIVGVSGIKGYVRIHYFTENFQDISEFSSIFDSQNKKHKIEKIISVKGNIIIVKITSIDSIEDAQKIVGLELFISRKDLKNLEEGYYYEDLINMNVYFENNILYGKIINVVNYGASDILEIEEYESGKVVMHPFSDEFILKVNLEEKKMIIKELVIV
jgi:16S rRNA processing protein RimM